MSYPIKWKPAPKELEEKRQKLFDKGSSLLNGLISEPYGLCCPPPMTKVAERIYNFKVRPDDIWIITYPKCGTTWMQVVLDTYLFRIGNIFLSLYLNICFQNRNWSGKL